MSTLYQCANATPIPADPRSTRAGQISTGTFAHISDMTLKDARKTDNNYNGCNPITISTTSTWRQFTATFIPL